MKSKSNRTIFLTSLIALTIAGGAPLQAQETQSSSAPSAHTQRQGAWMRFDANGDGRLDDAEKLAAREALAERQKQRSGRSDEGQGTRRPKTRTAPEARKGQQGEGDTLAELRAKFAELRTKRDQLLRRLRGHMTSSQGEGRGELRGKTREGLRGKNRDGLHGKTREGLRGKIRDGLRSESTEGQRERVERKRGAGRRDALQGRRGDRVRGQGPKAKHGKGKLPGKKTRERATEKQGKESGECPQCSGARDQESGKGRERRSLKQRR